MTRITIERETLQAVLDALEAGSMDVVLPAIERLRAALAAQPVDARRVVTWSAEALEGWKEAAIGWTVCASVHLEWAKGKDGVFKTRQADFLRHAYDARAKHAVLSVAQPAPAAVPLTECNDNDSPWLICKTCANVGKCQRACGMRPLTAEFIDAHIGPDEGDREAVTAIVREVEHAHGIGDKP